MKKLFILLFAGMTLGVYAQELNCKVNINSQQIEGSNKSAFTTLQNAISDFMNQTQFTRMTMTDNERIECNLLLIVNKVEDNVYSCAATVQSNRPVYGTSYMTPILNINDRDFNFTYQEYDRIEFSQPNQLSANLSALLMYYAYLIIGFDMDSYERMGGTPCFKVCEEIVQAAQSASLSTLEMAGWKAFDSNRNRYALINNIMDNAFADYRGYYYTYHRLGLDQMAQNVANARARIAEGLPILREAYRARPATYLVNTFLDAKNDELTQIFKQGTTAEKTSAYEILTAIDPTRDETYSEITK